MTVREKIMYITNYQMQNVLKVYSRHLTKRAVSKRHKAAAGKQPVDKISISLEGKRQTIYNNITANIVERITRRGRLERIDHKTAKQFQYKNDHKKAEFVYNSIDNGKKKRTNTLSIENSRFLISRLEQLASEAINKDIKPQTGESV